MSNQSNKKMNQIILLFTSLSIIIVDGGTIDQGELTSPSKALHNQINSVISCWVCDSLIDSECLDEIPHGIPSLTLSNNIRKFFKPCNWSINIVDYQCLTIYYSDKLDENDDYYKKHYARIKRQCSYDNYHLECYHQNGTNLICPCDYNGCNEATAAIKLPSLINYYLLMIFMYTLQMFINGKF